MRFFLIGALLLGSASTAAAHAEAEARCIPGSNTSRAIVRDFYQLALVDQHPAQAFQRYVAADFVEHKPDQAQPTRDGIAAYLEGMIKAMPGARWEMLRVVADGDMVALHARFTPAPGAPAYAIADFFRVQDCKIIEHWDVVSPPPKEQLNPNSRF